MVMVTITIPLRPVQQGSINAIPVKTKSGALKVNMIHPHSDALYLQRIAVQDAYREAGGEFFDKGIGVDISIRFSFLRPKSVSAKKRPYMTVTPDIDKLTRAILDALTNHAYADDSQVVHLDISKVYSDIEGTSITVSRYEA